MTGSHELFDAVRTAAARPDVSRAVADLYADLARRIDARRPVCRASGRCCRFEEFGHRLYVTTLELAAFVAQLDPAPSPAPITPSPHLPILPSNPGGCPFQVDGLCSVHAIRPFGCRVFFCDETSTDWQHDQYEHFHARLRQLHDRVGIPYYYVEWRQALASLGLSNGRPRL